MNETLKALHDPRLDLADMLCQLILQIRKILIHPDLQNHVKLADTTVTSVVPLSFCGGRRVSLR